MAKTNPFRFSTKYQDDETDLLYYGYRYYNASTGRWLSRDPVEERGGLNLHAFVRNEPTRSIDSDGRKTFISYPYPGQWVNDPVIIYPEPAITIIEHTNVPSVGPAIGGTVPPRIQFLVDTKWCLCGGTLSPNSFHFDIHIMYFNNSKPEDIGAGGMKIRDHEMMHAAYIEAYVERMNRILRIVQPDKCVSSKCNEARANYVNKASWYHWLILQGNNGAFDYTEYGSTEGHAEVMATQNQLSDARHVRDAAVGRMNELCRGEL